MNKKRNIDLLALVIVPVFLIFGYEFYVTLQFTEVAAVLTFAACILLCDIINDDKIKPMKFTATLVLLVLGFCYRWNECFLILGVSSPFLINVFLKKAVRVGGFPFDVNLDAPNRETIEAMLEAERIAKDPKVKAYSVDDAFQELDK